jgi:Fic family protein
MQGLYPQQDQTARIAVFLDWSITAAEHSAKELDKLALAEQLLQARLKGRRKSSRLPQLVDLLLEKPVISVPMAAKILKVSNQAVDAMLKELGSIPRELYGRGRYRVWGIV